MTTDNLTGTAFALRSKSPTNRRPLAKAEAARVVAEPFAERASGRGKPKAIRAEAWLPVWVWIAIMMAWAAAWVIAFAS